MPSLNRWWIVTAILGGMLTGGCSSPQGCPPGAKCPAVAPRVIFISTINGKTGPLRKDGHVPSYRVRSGEDLAVHVAVTVPVHVALTALWFGISAGTWGNGPGGRPTGMDPILAHYRQLLPAGSRAFDFRWHTPADRAGAGLYLTFAWSSHQPPASASGPVAQLRLTAGPPGYSVSLGRIVADANVQNQDDPFYRLAPAGTKVPMSEATAARAVIRECNEGRGTRVLVAGLVTGPVTSGSPVYWAVFVDPPGKHFAPSMEPVRKPEILNWIGAFVSVKTTQQPFCDFGRAANLPPLPVFVESPAF